MAKTIQTIDLVRWSEPDEQHRVKEIGMANAKEVFNKLEAHLKENNFLPDEYFLFSESNFVGERAELPQDTIDVICHTNYGGSEGIYLDISLRTRENGLVSFATGKTLSNNTEAFLHMSRIGAECSLMLNNGGFEIEMKETPEIAFKLKPEEEMVYLIIDTHGTDTLLQRSTPNLNIDPTPFIIASGAKTENGLIEWDSGKYFSNFNSAVKEFQKSMNVSQISEHIHSDKILQINELLAGIQDQNNIYSSVGKFDSNFDYDSVIASLQQVQQTIDDSLRFSRPDNIPEDMIWSEKPSNGFDDDFDPFVYDGSMSPEDFLTAQEQSLKMSQDEKLDLTAPILKNGGKTQPDTDKDGDGLADKIDNVYNPPERYPEEKYGYQVMSDQQLQKLSDSCIDYEAKQDRDQPGQNIVKFDKNKSAEIKELLKASSKCIKR